MVFAFMVAQVAAKTVTYVATSEDWIYCFDEANMTLLVSGPVRTGSVEKPTKLGQYEIGAKTVHGWSSTYFSPMLWKQRLVNGPDTGDSLHEGPLYKMGKKNKGSHGCVRQPWLLARALYDATSKGDKVIVVSILPKNIAAYVPKNLPKDKISIFVPPTGADLDGDEKTRALLGQSLSRFGNAVADLDSTSDVSLNDKIVDDLIVLIRGGTILIFSDKLPNVSQEVRDFAKTLAPGKGACRRLVRPDAEDFTFYAGGWGFTVTKPFLKKAMEMRGIPAPDLGL